MPDPKKKKKTSVAKKVAKKLAEGLVRVSTPIIGKKNVNKILYGNHGRDLSTPLAKTPTLKQSKRGFVTGVIESVPAMLGSPLKRTKVK